MLYRSAMGLLLLRHGGAGGRGYSIGWTEVLGPTTMEEVNGRKR
jgi:hypothetical protein